MIYEWVVPFEKVDANEAGKVCEELEHSVGLTKETLLDASRAWYGAVWRVSVRRGEAWQAWQVRVRQVVAGLGLVC